jgi:outer membrane immunogenic protein
LGPDIRTLADARSLYWHRPHCIAVGLNVGISSLAFAADMPAQAPICTKAPVAYNWTGCYIGVQAGGGLLSAETFTGPNNNWGSGGQAGCNYQAGQFVFGFEGEGAWSGITDLVVDDVSTQFNHVTVRNRWDADLAVRLGLAIDRTLVYGKAGAAFGSFDFGQSGVDVDGNPFFSHGQSTLGDLLPGAGLEYTFAMKSVVKVGVNYKFGN